MAAFSIADAKQFLYRYPWATTDIDDPVEIIRQLVEENESLESEIDQLRVKLNWQAYKYK